MGYDVFLSRAFRAALVCVTLAGLTTVVAQEKKLHDTTIFAPDHIVIVDIKLPEADWDKLRSQSRSFATAFGDQSIKPYSYFKGEVTVDGITIGNVGIRKKGFFGSQDRTRPSLKIKFDEYEKQQPSVGFDRLTLNNNKQDPSRLSQYLTYRIFNRAGIKAPRCNFAKVTVNGRYLGIYSNVESIKKPFLKRQFGDDSGNLYEGTITDFYIKSVGNFEAKTNRSNNDRAKLKQLAAIASKEGDVDIKALSKVIDLDNYLRYWAIESLIGFWDGYNANQNNFFVYDDPKTAKIYFIPWGADASFTNRNPLNRFSRDQSPVVYGQSMLANKLFRTKGFPERYRKVMREVLAKYWNEKTLLEEIDQAEKLLTGHFQSESRSKSAINSTRGFMTSRREKVENALADDNWPARIQSAPRKPSYSIVQGTAKGRLETNWNETSESKNQLQLTLGGKTVALTKVSVSVREGSSSGFGRFGGGGNSGPRPVTVTITGDRQEDGPVRMTLSFRPDQFRAGASLRVQGAYSEGNQSGGSNFFGFGGPRRSVRGTLDLANASKRDGELITATFNLEIVESRGGLFGGGNRQAASRPRPGAKKRGNRLKRGIALMRKHDKNANGKIDAAEWKDIEGKLATVDTDKDGAASLKEILTWLESLEPKEGAKTEQTKKQ